MTEWRVAEIIVVVVGLVVTVCTPIIKLNTSISKLIVRMDTLTQSLVGLTTDNSASHEKLWDHNDKQDIKLNDHETRISVLEHERNDNCETK